MTFTRYVQNQIFRNYSATQNGYILFYGKLKQNAKKIDKLNSFTIKTKKKSDRQAW